MTGSNISFDDVAGGPARHIPVMLNEVLSVLEPSPGQIIIDATFGAGGYSAAFIEAGAAVLAMDRDPDAISGGAGLVRKSAGQLTLVQGEFSDMDAIARQNGHDRVDGVVLDIGVSSMQIDQAERGFSFQKDGPLDMRMSQSGVSAADVVNQAGRNDLTRIIGILGEERKASLVSRAIVDGREKKEFSTTGELAKVVETVLGRNPKSKIHPATRTFQALRIFVNQELEQLGKALLAAERILKAGGRLVVVTFHSLEDRMVKLFFRDRSENPAGSRHMPAVNDRTMTFKTGRRSLIKASKDEAETNPRARSAKLRWATRTGTTVRNTGLSVFGLPDLASLAAFPQAGR